MDDVIIVSGHNLGTAPIEDMHQLASCGSRICNCRFPHDIKGNALYGFVISKESGRRETKKI